MALGYRASNRSKLLFAYRVSRCKFELCPARPARLPTGKTFFSSARLIACSNVPSTATPIPPLTNLCEGGIFLSHDFQTLREVRHFCSSCTRLFGEFFFFFFLLHEHAIMKYSENDEAVEALPGTPGSVAPPTRLSTGPRPERIVIPRGLMPIIAFCSS